MFDQIKNISFEEILDVVGIEYRKICGGLMLYEDGKPTSGWRVNTRENYANDFSEKGRPIGSPYPFIKQHLDLTDKETFEWFKGNFGLEESKGFRKCYKTFKKKKPLCSRYNRTR